MKRSRYLLFIGINLWFFSAASQHTFTNPVLGENFPDPTIIRGHDGWFYVYGTNTEVNDTLQHIQVARSRNMTDWERVGDALPQKPDWADRDFWAPHVLYDPRLKKYFMYYSGESPDTQTGKCIGVAVARKPGGPFADSGKALVCGESFINIDPMAFDDPVTGRRWLYWGSAHKPLKAQELANDRTSFKPGSAPVDILAVYKNSEYSKLIEGPWVHYRNGYYYLFYAGDNCCGDNANYAVMVARARKAEGPFEEFASTGSGSKPILVKNKAWLAPGHNSVITDDAGIDWIVYHAISQDESSNGGDRVMLMDRLAYKNGWPFVETGSPSITPQAKPIMKR